MESGLIVSRQQCTNRNAHIMWKMAEAFNINTESKRANGLAWAVSHSYFSRYLASEPTGAESQ